MMLSMITLIFCNGLNHYYQEKLSYTITILYPSSCFLKSTKHQILSLSQLLIKKHGQYIQFQTCCLQHFIFALMVSCLHQQNMVEKQFNITCVVKCSLMHFHKLFLHEKHDYFSALLFDDMGKKICIHHCWQCIRSD